MKKKITRLIAFMLSMLMLIATVPIYAIAESLTPLETTSVKEESTIEKADLTVIEENKALRAENIKHFKLSDGTTTAVVYGAKVHYKNESGEWVEINNALTLSGNEYSTKNKFEIQFANKSGSNKLLSIKDGGYKIEFTPVDASKSDVEITNPQSNNSRKFDDAKKLSSIVSRAKYKDIYNGIDLEYILIGESIKENIIVKGKGSSYSFDFEIQLNGLEAKLSNNSICFYDIDTGEEKYIIPAPYMYDANGEYSQDVEYVLTQNSKWKYTLTVSASEEWINTDSRTFPVTIDPTVIPSASNVTDMFTSSYANEDNSAYSYFYVGDHPFCMDSRAYLKLNTLPTIPNGAVMTSAKLAVFLENNLNVTDFKIGAFKVTNSWTPTTIVYNSSANYMTDAFPVDYTSVNASGVYTWDITELARGWYNGVNYGVCLKPVQQSATQYTCAIFTSSESTNYEAPRFEITYFDTKGIENRYSYYESSALVAGTGYVNSFTGELSFVHSLFTTADEILPYTLFATYNSHDKDWVLSTDESVSQIDTYLYKWIDGDGTEHYFSPEKEKNFFGSYIYYEYNADGNKMATSTPAKLYDEDGLGLTLTKNTAELVVISDDNGNQKEFDLNGRLLKITDSYGNVREFERNSDGKITKISLTPKNLSKIEQLTISYATNLVTVTNNQTGVYATVSYTNGKISSVEYNYSENERYTASFEYNSNGELVLAKDNEAQKSIRYTYSSSRVSAIGEIAYNSDTEVQGQSAQITYDLKKTTYRTSGNDEITGNTDDILTVYLFDNKGRAISAYTCDINGTKVYGSTNYVYNDKYTDENVGAKKHNSIKSTLQSGASSINLLKNSSFETNTTGWSKTGVGSISRSYPYAQELDISYGYSLAISSKATGTTKVRQTVPLTAGEYNFSLSLTKKSMLAGSSVKLKIYSPSNTVVAQSPASKKYDDTTTTLQGSWERESLSFSVTEAGSYKVSIELTSTSTGTQEIVYVDDIMLERNKGLGKLSVYDNGEFDQSVSSSNLLNATVGAGYGMLSQNGVNLTSTLSTQSYIKFTYKVESGYEPEKWVVSAWAKAENAVASTNSGEAELGIKIVTHFSGTTDTVEKLIPFNPENEDWQYACSKVVELPSDAINSTLYGQITTIDIYLCYNYNYGSAYFDKVSINRSGNATEYEYNNLGKLQKITNSNNQEATLEYENTASEPSKITDITGNSYDVSYNESHSVTGTTYTDANGSEKVNTEYTYTDQGQLSSTKQTAVNLNKNIITSSSYFVDTSRSYYSKTHIVTDERGNETEYFYYDNGLLKGVIGEDGNGILYEYNSYGELIGAILATRNSSGEIEAVALGGDIDYSYNSKHELDKVTTSSSEYSFVYDEWGKTIGIYVGDDALATYQYGENNGKLNRLTYGNGLYVEYVYDEIDRIIGICYNGTQEVAYEYASSGELSTITDIVNNTEYQYYYDGDGKLINERRIENGSSVTYNTFYEYDDYSRVTAIKRFFPSADTSVTSGVYYTYNSDGTISNIDQNIHSEAYTYDDFGRISNKSIIFGNNTLSSSYSYANVNENGTSSILSSVLTTIGSRSTQTSYTYDANGNITSILYGGKRVYYTYDAKGQLTREDNQALNETYVYTYDTAGNILARNTYAYTRSQTLGTAKSTKTYAYDSEWGDKLASINGTSFTYDAIGNPLKYYNAKNTYNFTWDNGRQLTSTAFNLGTVASYRYNQDGIRVGKTTEYIDYEYVLEDNKIIRQIETTIATGAIKDSCYYYDANGNIASAKINNNGTEYKLYFETNIQGDVLAVYNASGTCLMEITYDAYGNFTDTVTTSDSIPSMEQLIAVATPFRYRGYYYDNETSLYYLNSRYYDSANARFINADGYVSTGQGFNGNNMYAYCGNNPIGRIDEDGEWFRAVLGAIKGVVKQFVSDVTKRVITGKWDFSFAEYVGAAAGGAVAEYVPAGPAREIVEASVSTLVTAGVDGAIYWATDGEYGEAIDGQALAENIAKDMCVSAITEGLTPNDCFQENEIFDTVINTAVSETLEKASKVYKAKNTTVFKYSSNSYNNPATKELSMAGRIRLGIR